METAAAGNKLHPVLWVAAIAVILLSAAGIGAIFGLIPGVGGASRQAEPAAATVSAPAPTAAAEPAQPAAPESKPAEAAKPHAKPAHKPSGKLALEPAAAPTTPLPAAQPAPPPPPCRNCGSIEAVREIQQKGEATGLGAVAGGVGGALIGSQIGRGHGRDAATVLGAVGGAVAGHEIEKNVRKTVKYQVVVRYEDGSSQSFVQDAPPAWRPGDRVRVDNNVIMAR